MQVAVQVRLYGAPWGACLVDDSGAALRPARLRAQLCLPPAPADVAPEAPAQRRERSNTLVLSAPAYLLRPLLRELLASPRFRINLLSFLATHLKNAQPLTIYLKLRLRPPDRDIIDYGWNERMLREVWTRVEIDHALSWLSTLGGAFSALGDYFDRCADMAGKISIRQLQLSLVLGDESLAARSRLYSSLALAQQGKLRLARKVVRSVADFARQSSDRRLMRMCQGVWAKLRYLRYITNIKVSNEKGDNCIENGKVNNLSNNVLITT